MRPVASVSELVAYQIYDSRGQPTVEAKIILNNGVSARAAVPSGASTGVYEAVELRDNDPLDHFGKSVHKAVNNVNNILAPSLIAAKLDVHQQDQIDRLLLDLDGTENKSKLGANAILSCSMACVKASAENTGIPVYKRIAELFENKTPSLPVPFLNVINGGAHSGNLIAFQEFMVAPIGASNFEEAMKMGSEVYHSLKSLIKKKYGSYNINVGDEGGFAPNLSTVEECLDLLVETIANCGLQGKVSIALDVAASEFHLDERPGYYDLDMKKTDADNHRILSGDEMIQYYLSLIEKYPIISIEDPFDQNDWESWSKLTAQTSIQIVGDDLTVTNPKRIKEAIEKKACNALLLKINQIGSISESLAAAKEAVSAGWNVMVSHRSGETADTFISDMVVGLGVGQIKSGAPCRSERVAKYNRLLRIEFENKSLSIKQFNAPKLV